MAYATKAFLCRAMARLAHEEGLHLDVATMGEMHVALAADVPADRLVLHGNNKSSLELSAARQVGVGRIVVDSSDELDRLEALHAVDGLTPRVLLRVTPGVEAHTHEFVRTGQDDSKFGFTLSTGAAAEAVDRCRASSAVELVGIHFHIGSQVFVADFFRQAVEVVAPVVQRAGPARAVGGRRSRGRLRRRRGGPDDQRVGRRRPRPPAARPASPPGSPPSRGGPSWPPPPSPCTRWGRSSGCPGIRTYVAVDGGMSDNPRPVLYGSGYETLLARRPQAERPHHVTVVGKHCESGDLLVRDALVPDDLAVGDLLVTPVTGAYGHSMGSNYNKVLRPAVVFASEGRARVVVRRETPDDLLSTDVG